MRSWKLKALFGILAAITFLACADKVVSDTTYEDKFSVPIQKSGLPDSLAIDSVKVFLTTAVSKDTLFDTTFRSLFVYMDDPTFTYISTERVNLVYSYQVYAEGTLILWSNQTILSEVSSGTKLEAPEKADSATIAEIKEQQNTRETELSLRTNPNHEECVVEFAPNTITAVGTKQITISFQENESANCTFLGWKLELENGGSANLVDTASKIWNKVIVSGAKGYIIAEFLLPGEVLSSMNEGSSSSIASTDKSSSGTQTTGSSSSTTTSNGKELTVTINGEVITRTYVFADTSFTISGFGANGRTITDWNVIDGITVNWLNGSDSLWTVTVTYDQFNPDANYTLEPAEIDLSSTKQISIYANTWPAMLYPSRTEDAPLQILAMKTDGTGFSLTDIPLNSAGNIASQGQDYPRNYTLPDKIDPSALFKSPIVLGKRLFEGGNMGLLVSGSSLYTAVVDAETSSPNITVEPDIATEGTPKAYDYLPDGMDMVAAYQADSAIKIRRFVGGVFSDSIITVSPQSGSGRIFEMNDIVLSTSSEEDWVAVISNTDENYTDSRQTLAFGKSNSTSATVDLFSSDGTFNSVIPSKKTIGSYYIFGNYANSQPEVALYHPTIQYMTRKATLPMYFQIPMEFIGGRELDDGRVLAWGTNVGVNRFGTTLIKENANVYGVVALFDANLKLIWKRYMPGQLPFGAVQAKNSTFFVSTIAAPITAKSIGPLNLFHLGFHGEY